MTESSVVTVAPVPTTRSLTCKRGRHLAGRHRDVGLRVDSSLDTPAGSSGKFATGVATTLGLVVQPGAVVGICGVGDADVEPDRWRTRDPDAAAAATSSFVAADQHDEQHHQHDDHDAGGGTADRHALPRFGPCGGPFGLPSFVAFTGDLALPVVAGH